MNTELMSLAEVAADIDAMCVCRHCDEWVAAIRARIKPAQPVEAVDEREIRDSFKPAFDDPQTAAEAVSVLDAWSDPLVATFSHIRAKKCADAMRSVVASHGRRFGLQVPAALAHPRPTGDVIATLARRVVSWMDTSGYDDSALPGDMGMDVRLLRDALGNRGYAAPTGEQAGEVVGYFCKDTGEFLSVKAYAWEVENVRPLAGYVAVGPQPRPMGVPDANDIAIDSAYAAGMVLGWNLCTKGDHEQFEALRKARVYSAAEAAQKRKAAIADVSDGNARDAFDDGVLLALQVLNAAGNGGDAHYMELLGCVDHRQLLERARSEDMLDLTGIEKWVAYGLETGRLRAAPAPGKGGEA